MCNVLASDLFRNLGTSKISIPFACLYNYSVSILNKRQFFFIKRLLRHEGVRGNTLSWTSWQLWCWRKRHFWDLILRLERLYRKWLWPLLLRIRPFRTYSTLSQIAHTSRLGRQKMKLTSCFWWRGVTITILCQKIEHFCYRNFFIYCLD